MNYVLISMGINSNDYTIDILSDGIIKSNSDAIKIKIKNQKLPRYGVK